MVDRLIIDDVRTYIADRPSDLTVHASNIESAKKELALRHWDEVWFDFDMGPDDDMMRFARDIVTGAVPVVGFDLAVVHSMSPVGRMYLFSTLKDHYKTTLLPISLTGRLFRVE